MKRFDGYLIGAWICIGLGSDFWSSIAAAVLALSAAAIELREVK